MSITDILALLLCLGAFAAPFSMRTSGWGWIARLIAAAIIIAIVAAIAVALHHGAGVRLGLALVGCYGLGELILMVYDRLKPPSPWEIYPEHVTFVMESPHPVVKGSVETRAPKADPEFLRRFRMYQRNRDYQPGSHRQIRT